MILKLKSYPSRKKNEIQRMFTLLEVMVAIVLIAIMGGVVSYKMSAAIERKKFQSDVDRIKARMAVAQKLAVASQADWSGILKKEKDGWLFSVRCEEIEGKEFKPLRIAEIDVMFGKKKVTDQIAFDFFASGHTSPEDVLVFQRGLHQSQIHLKDLFQRDEGKKLGPTHPNEI